MKKQTASIIGIALGIAIIIVGFCVQGIGVEADGHESYGTPTIGNHIKFGADFYTEMYAVTQDVGEAVNSANENIHGAVNVAQRNICGAVESVCDAVGWLIIAIGLVDIAYFAYKMAPREADGAGNTCDVKPTTATPAYMESRHQVSTSAPAPGVAHSWRCDSCGNMATQSPCEHCGYADEKEHIPYWCGNCGHAGPYDDRCPTCGSSLKRFNVSQN